MGNFPQPIAKRLVALIAALDRRLKLVEHRINDPVAIGTSLARTALQSPGYVPGASGWILNNDGSGEVTASVTVVGGGMKATIGPTAPASPNVGDLWYDSNNGFLLNQWNGAVWTPYQFGTGAIQTGSVTADLMAANAITAGTIAAGAIDGFTINGAVINGQQITSADFIISGINGGLFTYGSGGTTVESHVSAGTGSWIAPNNVTTVTVELWGAGAGGGGNGGASFLISGAAGGGGQYVKYVLSVTPGNSYSWSIGAHGIGGSGAGVNGTDGAPSWFGSSATAQADGGTHGQSGNTGASGGLGGNATPPGSPAVVNNGGRGGNGVSGGPAGGGGGGSSGGYAAPGSQGGNGRGAPNSGYGSGAAAPSGGGPGARGGGANLSPFAGQVPAAGPAGGGGGAGGDGGGSRAGGNGWDGKMVLTYTPSSASIMVSVAGAPGTDAVSSETFPAGVMVDAVNAPVVAADPVAGGPETWHNITLDAGWTVSGTATPGYRILPTGDVQLRGTLTHASFTAAVSINSGTPMPTAYRPANSIIVRTADSLRAGLQQQSNGVLQARPLSTGNASVDLGCIYNLGD